MILFATLGSFLNICSYLPVAARGSNLEADISNLASIKTHVKSTVSLRVPGCYWQECLLGASVWRENQHRIKATASIRLNLVNVISDTFVFLC